MWHSTRIRMISVHHDVGVDRIASPRKVASSVINSGLKMSEATDLDFCALPLTKTALVRCFCPQHRLLSQSASAVRASARRIPCSSAKYKICSSIVNFWYKPRSSGRKPIRCLSCCVMEWLSHDRSRKSAYEVKNHTKVVVLPHRLSINPLLDRACVMFNWLTANLLLNFSELGQLIILCSLC